MYQNLVYSVNYESGACGNFLAAMIRNHVFGYDIIINEYNNAHHSKKIINYSKPDFIVGETGLTSRFEIKRKFKKKYAFLEHIQPIGNQPIIVAEHHSLGSGRYGKIKSKWPNLKMVIITMTEEDMWQAAGQWITKTKFDFDNKSKHWWNQRPANFPTKWPKKIKSLDDITVKMMYDTMEFRVERHKKLLGWNTEHWMYDSSHPNLQRNFIHFVPFRLFFTDRITALNRFCKIFNIEISSNLEKTWIEYMEKNIELAKKWMPFLNPYTGKLLEYNL